MRVGLLLPLFHDDATMARDAAAQAADRGCEGVFAYDHLWPMGSPHRPALAPFPVLADIAVRHPQLAVGPLVARVGLTSAAHLRGQFAALRDTGSEVICALGTGDSLSADENRGYGLPLESAENRRQQLEELVSDLARDGEVWVGGGGEKTNAIARRHGATLNLWNVSVDELATRVSGGPVSWAGVAPEDIEAHLAALAAAGATWAVYAPQTDLDALGRALNRRG